MRHSSQIILGLVAIVSIMSVQTMDMSHGHRHFYTQAVNDISTDDGLIFDAKTATAVGVQTIAQMRNAFSAA